jgi:hypothetical protein
MSGGAVGAGAGAGVERKGVAVEGVSFDEAGVTALARTTVGDRTEVPPGAGLSFAAGFDFFVSFFGTELHRPR